MKYLLILLLFLFAGCEVREYESTSTDPEYTRYCRKVGQLGFFCKLKTKSDYMCYIRSGHGLTVISCSIYRDLFNERVKKSTESN